MFKLIAVALSFSLAAGTAFAQAYPGKPIRIVVPFAAGGTSDILARAAVRMCSRCTPRSRQPA